MSSTWNSFTHLSTTDRFYCTLQFSNLSYKHFILGLEIRWRCSTTTRHCAIVVRLSQSHVWRKSRCYSSYPLCSWSWACTRPCGTGPDWGRNEIRGCRTIYSATTPWRHQQSPTWIPGEVQTPQDVQKW